MFFLIALLVVFSGHWYIWSRLVRDPAWGSPWTAIGTAVLILLGLYLPLATWLSRALPREWSTPLSAMAFTWMGLGFLFTVAFVATDLVKWLGVGLSSLLAGASQAPVDPVRRELLARGAAGAASALAVGTGAVALRSGLADVEVKEVPVRLERLPSQLSGYTIVQLTDVHVGPLIGKGFIDQIVEKANAERPDAIVITGDLVDGSVAELERHVAPLSRLQARDGVYFVTGNHEYYSGVAPWIAHLERLGIRVLQNERVSLGDAKGRGASFDLAGIHDESAARFGGAAGAGLAPDLERALEGRDPERELVLLAHQPKSILRAAQAGVGLQLSGHTHGGQIWPFNYLVPLQQPYVKGLHLDPSGAQVYVSCGTGFWGPPMRLGAPAEVTKVVLV